MPDTTLEQELLKRIRRELLADIDPQMSAIEVFDGPPLDPRAGPQSRAEVRAKDPRIFLNRNTRVFQDAMKGKRDAQVDLAAMLDHEHRHIYGSDEANAYAAQLARLRELGASRRTINDTERAMDYVLRAARNRVTSQK